MIIKNIFSWYKYCIIDNTCSYKSLAKNESNWKNSTEHNSEIRYLIMPPLGMLWKREMTLLRVFHYLSKFSFSKIAEKIKWNFIIKSFKGRKKRKSKIERENFKRRKLGKWKSIGKFKKKIIFLRKGSNRKLWKKKGNSQLRTIAILI